MTQLYRIRRRSDGVFLGARKWGQTHYSVTGKFYATISHATSAAKVAGLMGGHELVTYDVVEGSTLNLLDVVNAK